ncbi:MAG: hypothetical protein G01um101472_292 [Parcubacteria group bacterium Gr01-1014_72]|nr:MAG: hypothetical protein G01um101472_292 [Parcubacteria group bacterium Gr01-1014_72]
MPNVNWNDGKLKVNWNNVSSRFDNLRSREVSRIKAPIAGLFALQN